jgi:predicted AlkP superfamily pyrophosphatase or phosphodiesterase
MASGVVFPSGYQSHAATETCPGHSTILTGAHPARTGIVANNYFDLTIARPDKRVYCMEDETVEGTSSETGSYAPSIKHLNMPTLGDRMKDINPATQVVSVAGKDRAAILMGGKKADEVLWISPTGLSSYRGTALSPRAAAAATVVKGAIDSARPAMDLPRQCASRDIAVSTHGGQVVGQGRFARPGGLLPLFAASPEADSAVLAVAASLRAARGMGEGETTDLLSIGLSATDYVGHATGTGGTEMCIQMLALDRELGEFFKAMDATGIDYAVALTADHGGHDIPERNRQNAIADAKRVDAYLVPDRKTHVARKLNDDVAAKAGVTGDILFADAAFGDYYLSPALTPAQRKAALAELLRILDEHADVDSFYTRDQMAAMPLPLGSPETWTLAERIRANFDPKRSGDVYVVLDPRVTPIAASVPGFAATHGSIWDYDRRVPILFWRKGMVAFEQPNPVRTIDIMPTLAALIRLPVNAPEIDGRCLDLMAGPASSCTP